MKIANLGLTIAPGKYKYSNASFEKLIQKFSPQKITPYTVEIVEGDLEKADAIVFDNNKKLDFVLIDLDKAEKRLERSADENEKAFLLKAKNILEKEELLCDHEFSSQEKEFLKVLAFVTYKPSLGKDSADNVEQLIEEIRAKAHVLLFFTAGKKEVRAWAIKKGDTILEAAARIHTDLARGFIKGDVVNCKDLDSFFNMAEAKAKGLVKVVDRDYLMQEGDIIEIRFNV